MSEIRNPELENKRAVQRDAEGIEYNYKILQWDNLMEDVPPPVYTVGGLIETESVVLVTGQPGSFKSYALLTMAVCAAAGKPWLGFEMKQCSVLYLDEETSANKLKRRIQAIMKGLGIPEDVEIPLRCISLSDLKLDVAGNVNELYYLMELYQVDLMMLDTFSHVMDGNENDKSDVQPVMNAAKRLADKHGATLLFIHHPPKHGTGARGSGAIGGSADMVVDVTIGNDKNHVIFETTKVRDVEYRKWAAIATFVDGGFTLTETDTVAAERGMDKNMDHVVNYLAENGESSGDDVVNCHPVWKPPTMRKALNRAVEGGLVVRTNPGEKGRGVQALFDIAPPKDNISTKHYMDDR